MNKKPVAALSNPKDRREIIRGLLKKHAAVVHIEGSIGIVERRAYNILLLYAMGQGAAGGSYTYSIPVATLKDLIGFNSKNDEHLKLCIKNLQKTVLEVNLLQDGKVKWESMTLLSYAAIAAGVCTYRFDPGIVQYVLSPDIYASINLSVQNLLGSARALALYENCARFRNVGSTGAIELPLLRLMLGAHREKSYEDFRVFNRDCLGPAIAEVNKHSDLRIEPELIKEKRRVTAVRFRISDNPQSSLFVDRLDSNEAAIKRSGLFLRLMAIGLSESQALLYAQSKDKARVEYALRYAESKEGARERHRHFLAMLACEADVRQMSPDQVEHAVAQARHKIDVAESAARVSSEAGTAAQSIAQRVQAHIATMTAQQIREIMADFYAERPTLVLDENGVPVDNFQRKNFLLRLRAKVAQHMEAGNLHADPAGQ